MTEVEPIRRSGINYVTTLNPGDEFASYAGMAIIVNPNLPPRIVCLTTGEESVLCFDNEEAA